MRAVKAIAVLLSTLLSAGVSAHDSRPLFIELKELQTGVFRLQWKIPSTVPSTNLPSVQLPQSCERQGEVVQSPSASGMVRRTTYLCGDALSGQAMVISYPGANPSLTTLVRYSAANGQASTTVLGPSENTWSVPDAETPAGVAGHYFVLGVEHILIGIDHLLFLVCLLWIAGTGRRILITVTGFTLAHSFTLVLASLGIVTIPIAPVEAVIALSIVFLATEMAKGRRNSVTWRHPIAVASSFGLLHGFGFANALYEVGLPQTEIPLALLFFNVGVEAGQLLFVSTVIGLGLTGKQLMSRSAHLSAARRWQPQVQTAVVYGVGTMASFWLVERTYGFW